MFPSIFARSWVPFSTFASPAAEFAAIEQHEYIDRRRTLAARLRDDISDEKARRPLVIVIASARQQFYAPDVPYPYRESSYFRYLTGLVQPKSVLTIVDRHNEWPQSILYVTSMLDKLEFY